MVTCKTIRWKIKNDNKYNVLLKSLAQLLMMLRVCAHIVIIHINSACQIIPVYTYCFYVTDTI